MNFARAALVLVLSSVTLGACSKGSTPAQESAAPVASVPAQSAAPAVPPAATQAPPQAPTPVPAEPSMFSENAQESEAEWVGVVVSTIDVADSKTMYIELAVNGKNEWVASKSIELKAGDKVKVGAGALQMENFASSSLGRTFDKIWLASEVEKID